MLSYIIPNIEKYDSVDALTGKDNAARSKSESQLKLSKEEVLEESFLCIVGAPGVGKSRLIKEILLAISAKEFVTESNASEFDRNKIPVVCKYCVIDALDEVDDNKFYHVLSEIRLFKEQHPSVHVIFSCRSHYVSTYRQLFVSCKELHYWEIHRLSEEVVKTIIKDCSQNTQESITKSPKLLELLRIPRYLNFLLELEDQTIECKTIGDLYEYIIGKSIEQALDSNKALNNNNTKILVQRVLEKIAFVVEIGRKDSITKDELYTILDGLTGNMAQMLIANVDLFYFQNRILIDNGKNLKFENTQLQEYLAAKELCRQGNIESVFYDLAVQKELRHIYPNWFDIITHISYLSDSDTFINIIKLIAAYERNLDSDVFARLIKYVEPESLRLIQKAELFKLLFENFHHNNVYISWRDEVLRLLTDCYSFKCNDVLLIPYENLNNIQLYNISTVLEALCKEKQILEVLIKDYWINAAKNLIKSEDADIQKNAIRIFDALEDTTNLIALSSSYNNWEQDTRNLYLEVTGYGKITDQTITKIWLEECYNQNPYAINAILNQKEAEIIASIYNKIVQEDKIPEFLSPRGNVSVFYDIYLPKQFQIIWDKAENYRLIMTKIICLRVQHHHYLNNKDYDRIIRTIMLNRDTAHVFVNNFEYAWSIERVLTNLDSSLIDAALINTVAEALSMLDSSERIMDRCILMLVNKIRKDKTKKGSIDNYLSKYADTFNQWDNSPKEEEINRHIQNLDEKYNILSDKNTPEHEKLDSAYELCKSLNYLSNRDITSFIDIVSKYFGSVDLDHNQIRIISNDSYTISKVLRNLPIFIRTLYKLGYKEILYSHRVMIAKTLPAILCTYEFDDKEIRDIYKKIIGDIESKEKEEIVLWWTTRNDDFMNFKYDNIISCITDYGFIALSYKLEEYVEKYIECQGTDHLLAASKSLELIATDKYCHWSLEKYQSVFEKIKNEDVDSLKMMCNGIIIEKFQDNAAIQWRINYLKTHRVKSLDFQSGHARAISSAEAEMTSQNPRMFRCFRHIDSNEYLDEQMFDLFNYTLSFVEDRNYLEYAEYLLQQICLYFIDAGKYSYFCNLRNKVAGRKFTKSVYKLNNILSKAEIQLLQNTPNGICSSTKLYNRCLEKTYLPIKNEYDLKKYFLQIEQEIQKAIQDEGIYSIVRQENLSEDFIQRELKNTIINKCCQMGLTEVRIDREVTLQDNKRTDILMSYGMCRPIMIELKLLNNDEIQKDDKRKDYKKKFIQYMNATNACLSVFWIFDVKKNNSNIKKAESLKEEYSDLNDTIVILSDCKCSCESNTGIPKKKNVRKKNY